MIGNTPLTKDSFRLRGFVNNLGLELEYDKTDKTYNVLRVDSYKIESNEVKTWVVWISNMRKYEYSDIWYTEGHSMITNKLSTEEEFDLLFEIITGEKVKLLKIPKPNPDIILKIGNSPSTLIGRGGYSRHEKLKFNVK